MSVIGFDHYNLCAPRELLESLRLFYTEVVGLTDGYRPSFNSFGYWLYAGEHAVLHLSESAQSNMPPQSGEPSFNHAAFSCSGLADFEKKLAQNGIEYTTAHVPDTAIVQIFISDPAGNGVEISFADES
jgi:catechol-2,3-dioxygenase